MEARSNLDCPSQYVFPAMFLQLGIVLVLFQGLNYALVVGGTKYLVGSAVYTLAELSDGFWFGVVDQPLGFTWKAQDSLPSYLLYRRCRGRPESLTGDTRAD